MKTIDRKWLVVILLVGLCLRFSALGHKVYWHDEVYTSIRATGHTGQEIATELFDGRIVAPADLLQYRQLEPDKSLGDTAASLSSHPEHPPLYYFLARLWMGVFGDSTAAVRSFSAALSVLVFPALYWLCWELFSNAAVGTVAIALLAVSPFHLLYAQEAREYSLWTITIVVSSAAVLRALRLNHFKDWGLYALTVIVGLYTSLFAVLPTVAQGLYVLFQGRRRRAVQGMLFALILAGIAYIPWLITFFTQLNVVKSKTAWINASKPWSQLVTLWGLHITSPFVDLGLDISDPRIYIRLALAIAFLALALWTLIRQTQPQIWVFVLLLIGVGAGALIVPDLLLGGQRSGNTRYFITAFIGLQIAVAFLITHWLSSSRTVGRGVFIGLLGLGLVSCLLILRSPTWWNKWFAPETIATANFLNQLEQPLVISDTNSTNIGHLISMSDRLKDSVQFQLYVSPDAPTITQRDTMFLFMPSAALLTAIETQPNVVLKPVAARGVPLRSITLAENAPQP